MRRSLVFAAAIAALLAAVPAEAQTTDRARAQSRFEAGRRHVKAGRCDLAIEEFRSSLDFEPTSVGAHLNLGDCYVTLGRFVDAFRAYKDAERHAKTLHDARIDEARNGAAATETKLVRIVLREGDAPADVVVSVDGAPAGKPPWLISVMPGGTHVVEARTADGRHYRESFAGSAGEVLRFTIKLVADASSPPKQEPSKASALADEDEGSGRRTAGLVVGGIGAAGIVTGAVFGSLALVWRRDLESKVNGNPRCVGSYPDVSCDVSARDDVEPLQRRALFASTASTIAFIAGGTLFASGVVLYLTAPKNAERGRTNVRVKVGTGVGLEGSF